MRAPELVEGAAVQAGESPSTAARALGVTVRTMAGWLARCRRGGWSGLKSKPCSAGRRSDRARDAMD
ncbi:MAG: helix-turn-helix domain-containing protein [Pseudomonadota bacterium]|nr:helix-turn-helix domain-containing protein [Pseudomonadota bacterium]